MTYDLSYYYFFIILFLGTFKRLTPDHTKEVLQFMFSEVNKTNSYLCFQQLHDMLEDNEVHIKPKRYRYSLGIVIQSCPNVAV